MKTLVTTLALFSLLSLPVAAQDALNPTSEQLDQAIEQLQQSGIDTSQLPSKDKLKQMLSGEQGRKFHEMAKQMQQQNPEQFQQMRDKVQAHFDKNGDGTLEPREREMARRAMQQRQQSQQGGDQNAIRVKRRVDGAQPQGGPQGGQQVNQAGTRYPGNLRQTSDRGSRPTDADAGGPSPTAVRGQNGRGHQAGGDARSPQSQQGPQFGGLSNGQPAHHGGGPGHAGGAGSQGPVGGGGHHGGGGGRGGR